MKDARDAAFLSRGAAKTDREPTPAAEAALAQRLTAILETFGALLREAIARNCPRTLGLDTADIEQEARIRLWNALRNEREIANLPSYLYRVAASATIDAVRRAKARREDPLEESAEQEGSMASRPSPGASPERLARDRQIAGKVKLALDRLEEKRRHVVKLHLQGFSTDEVARLMEWTEPKARNLVYRGLADLRRELHALGIDRESL